jgi:hypothetical protein
MQCVERVQPSNDITPRLETQEIVPFVLGLTDKPVGQVISSVMLVLPTHKPVRTQQLAMSVPKQYRG